MMSIVKTPATAWAAPVVGLVVAATLAVLVAVLQYYAGEKARLEAAVEVRQALGDARLEVDRRLKTALAVPETLAAVIASSNGISDPLFRDIAIRLIRSNPSIRNLAMAPDDVITRIYPVRGNEAALGLDFAKRPDQYASVVQARRTRSTVVAGPIRLVQGGSGLVSRTPVFMAGHDGGDSHYWGLVSIAVDVDDLFKTIDRIETRHGVVIAVRAVDQGVMPGEPFHGAAAVFESQPISMPYPLQGGGRWEIGGVPKGGWQSVRAVSPVAAVLAYLVAGLAGWLAYRLLASHEQERRMASRDALTGLLNRKAFDHRLQQAVERGGVGQALVVLDLDEFKPVNDTHGHRVGDQVLAEVAMRLRQAVPDPHAVFRIGGDEFAILLKHVATTTGAIRTAEQAVVGIEAPFRINGMLAVRISASAGVAPFPLDGVTEHAADVFDRADRALYRGKVPDGGRVHADPDPGSTGA